MKATALLAIAAIGIIFASVCLGQSAPTASAPTSASRPALRFTIGKDTTRITEPLLPDGRPDYLGAINAACSKGVTKENNAAVLYIQATGIDVLLSENIRDRALKLMGMDPPTGPFLTNWTGDRKELDTCLNNGPVKAADHPEVAKWIQANAKPLDLMVAASQRPRWYIPFLSPEGERLQVLCAIVPRIGNFIHYTRMLCIRAKFAAAEGRQEDAARDILAVARLGKLLDQGPSLVERFVGISCSMTADTALQKLAVSGSFDAKTSAGLIKQLEPIGTAGVITAIDQCERYFALDSLSWASTQSPTEFLSFHSQFGAAGTPDKNKQSPAGLNQALALSFTNTDWNDTLKLANTLYDRMIAGMQSKDRKSRQDAFKKIDDELREMGSNVKDVLGIDGTSTSPNVDMGKLLVSILVPKLSTVQTFAEKSVVTRDLSLVALTLAAHKAEKGKYPAALSELAPAYLKAVPKDYFSGKDLVYKPQGAGYILYSVGDDLEDNGGQLKDIENPNSKYDIVVKAEK